MNFGKIAIVKPDHLGDLILSAPAIRVLQERLACNEIDLFVSPHALKLGQFLFSDLAEQGLNLKTIVYPHLEKQNSDNLKLPLLEDYDSIISLRTDHLMTPDYFRAMAKRMHFQTQNENIHETEIQKKCILPVIGDYSIEEYFFKKTKNYQKPKNISSIGLCISAGHSINSWSIYQWYDLAINLISKFNKKICLIGGPAEHKELLILKKLLSLEDTQIIVGGSDFNKFGHDLESVDIIIATDSGSAHICSLWKPIVSIFGPSPHFRFAPFGQFNKVISLNLSCSPCLQFSKTHLNLCATKECLNSVTINQVIQLLLHF